MTDKFKDAKLLDSNEGKVICYRSSLAVMEEGFYNGVPVSLGYNASGYPLNVLSNCTTRLNPHDFGEPFSFIVEADGANVCHDMTFDGFTCNEENGNLHSVAVYSCKIKPLRIYEHTILDGTDIFTRYLEIENLSDSEISLSRLMLHGGGIEKNDRNHIGLSDTEDIGSTYSYGCFDNDEWGREGEFSIHTLAAGATVIDRCFTRSRFRHPAILIKNNSTGVIYSVQAGWSGGVSFRIDYNAKSLSGTSALSYGVELTGINPLYKLAKGEKLTTPEVHFGVIHGGIDDVVNENIAHIRKSVLNAPEADGSSLLVGGGMGAEHDMDMETSLAFAKQLHDMGAEVFIVDAGWVCPPHKETEWYSFNGINKPDSHRYPDNGLAKIREYCHSMGMKFGLWMEPERMGDKSDIVKEHPEWCVKNIYGESSGLIDMTIPEAAQWAENEISRIIEEYRLDLLRIDYNVGGNETFTVKEGECISLRHFNAVYGMYRRLKKKYPSVIFENCAGGGGRTDLGHMKAFNHTWVSDNQIMPRSLEITNGMTMVLPPERVDRLFAGMGCHTTGDIYAHLRNTMLGHMSLNVISPVCLDVNTDSAEFIRRSVSLYKEQIRPMLPSSLIYHHTPDRKAVEKSGFRITEIASPDKSKGFITVFTVSGTGRVTVFPRGISPSKKYEVYLDNDCETFTLSGKEIVSGGITLSINTALSSELIAYKEI